MAKRRTAGSTAAAVPVTATTHSNNKDVTATATATRRRRKSGSSTKDSISDASEVRVEAEALSSSSPTRTRTTAQQQPAVVIVGCIAVILGLLLVPAININGDCDDDSTRMHTSMYTSTTLHLLSKRILKLQVYIIHILPFIATPATPGAQQEQPVSSSLSSSDQDNDVFHLDLQRNVRIATTTTTTTDTTATRTGEEELQLQRGLVLQTAVAAGDVLVRIPQHHTLCVARLEKEYPTLRTIVHEILARVATTAAAAAANEDASTTTVPPPPAPQNAPSVTEFLLTLAALLEWSKGRDKSKLYSYFQSFPETSPPLLGVYWTTTQHDCVFGDSRSVAAAESTSSSYPLPAFREAWRILREERPKLPLQEEETLSPSFAEYMYTMVLTRGFGGCLVPVLDMANHDPLMAVPPFQSRQSQTRTIDHILVATHDMEAGAPVYNSYGNHLAVDQLFASYGYVPTIAVLVTAPSLQQVVEQYAHNSSTADDDAMFQKLCIGADLQFYGPQVPNGKVVSAQWNNGATLQQTTTYAPGRPTQLTYQCLRVVWNAPPSGADMAQWIVPYLRADIQRLDTALNLHCGGHADADAKEEDDNPHRRVNRMAREALQYALEIAEAAAQGLVDYPGIVYP